MGNLTPMNKTITTIIVATLLATTMFGLRHIDQLNDGIQLKKIELQDNSAKLKILDSKYQELNTELDKTGSDKQKIEQELKQLQIERDELQRQLQARLNAKQSDIAQRAQNAVTRTAVASASGSCADWIAAAGIPDVANANELIGRESGCNPCSYFPSKSNCNLSAQQVNDTCATYYNGKCAVACGIAQELPCGKSGCARTDGACQVKWMNGYVTGRYGSWANAVAFHNANNWY